MTEIKNYADTAFTDNFNLEHFFELSADLFCIAGYDGYFKKINSSVSKTLGYTNEELFAKPIHEFIYSDDKHITADKRLNLIADTPLLNFENRYLTKSGEIVWLSWTSMPVKSEEVVFAIAKNITHKKKLDEDRNALLADFTKINQNLKQLTYSTSHDLRMPVSNLLSVFNLLDISKIQDEETLEFIGMLRSSTESLRDTLNNYVDQLSQKNVLMVHTEAVDINECLNSALQGLQSLIQSSGAKIQVNLAELKTVNFNRAYLESVFLNLITNSIKYAKPHQCPVISISSKRENGVNQLLFADEGQGFDMDKVKNKIFGLNQKFHNNNDSKGIGLYLVYNHVISLGGKIVVDSKLNEGAKFEISFKD
ncbi:PAS domain-containing sensor histidine kinase [Mucilaginibacter sp.]|uniref:PAS domain-containing sensor histidine kinase n=1 Tax=Mucilaginibacter sp. TaxID=1882438 RepID=UPI003D0FAA2C